jgi:hypothetical protein
MRKMAAPDGIAVKDLPGTGRFRAPATGKTSRKTTAKTV